MITRTRLKRFIRICLWVEGIILGIFLLTEGTLYILKSCATKLGPGGARCPFGHTTISVHPLGFESLEVYAAAYTGHCDTCGYDYDPRIRTWTKLSKKKSDFVQPFSWPISELSVHETTQTIYVQFILDGKTMHEIMEIRNAPYTTTTLIRMNQEFRDSLLRHHVKQPKYVDYQPLLVTVFTTDDGRECSGNFKCIDGDAEIRIDLIDRARQKIIYNQPPFSPFRLVDYQLQHKITLSKCIYWNAREFLVQSGIF